jgi:hypothetical protein
MLKSRSIYWTTFRGTNHQVIPIGIAAVSSQHITAHTNYLPGKHFYRD